MTGTTATGHSGLGNSAFGNAHLGTTGFGNSSMGSHFGANTTFNHSGWNGSGWHGSGRGWNNGWHGGCWGCGFGWGFGFGWGWGLGWGFGGPGWWGWGYPYYPAAYYYPYWGWGYPARPAPANYPAPYSGTDSDYNISSPSSLYPSSTSYEPVPEPFLSTDPVTGNVALSTPTLLLYAKDGTTYAANDYWIADGKLHYSVNYGAESVMDMNQLDLQRTADENAKRGVRFSLKPNADSLPADTSQNGSASDGSGIDQNSPADAAPAASPAPAPAAAPDRHMQETSDSQGAA